MDRRKEKELIRVGIKMDYGLGGMKMDRRVLKVLTRMEKRFLPNVGMKMGMNVNVVMH